MSSAHTSPLDLQMIENAVGPYQQGQASPQERGAIYQELLGFVPPRIRSRFAVTGALDPNMH